VRIRTSPISALFIQLGRDRAMKQTLICPIQQLHLIAIKDTIAQWQSFDVLASEVK
jgi:hypothetical protein